MMTIVPIIRGSQKRREKRVISIQFSSPSETDVESTSSDTQVTVSSLT